MNYGTGTARQRHNDRGNPSSILGFLLQVPGADVRSEASCRRLIEAVQSKP